MKGKVKFNLFPYQRDLLNDFRNFRFNIILKPRQMGVSWLVAGYVLWLAGFHFEKVIEMISIKEDTAVDLLRKCKYIYGNLPDFLRAVQTPNQTEMNFSIKDKNGKEYGLNCMIRSLPSSENAGRSAALSLLVLDEAAFIRWAEEIWASAYPTLSTGGSAIILSTFNGVGGTGAFFYKMWEEAKIGQNMFKPTQLYWNQYPGRDQKWFDEQQSNMPPVKFAQEVLCEAIQSGSPVFEAAYLKLKCKEQGPGKNTVYLIGCDPAEGGPDNDKSVIEIIDHSTGDEVFSKSFNCPPEVFARKIDNLTRKYRGIVGVERNNHGHAVIQELKRLGTPGLYIHHDGKYGWLETKSTKPFMINDLEEALRNNKLNLSSRETADELKLYQYKDDGSTGAQEGYHDDRVIALGIAWQMRKSRYVFNIEKVKALEDKYVRDPGLTGDIIETQGTLAVRETGSGRLKIWEWPQKKSRYAIGAVPMILDGDVQNTNVGVVLDRSNYSVVAIYSESDDFDIFALHLNDLGRLYNSAMIGLDESLHAETIRTVLEDFNYPNVYNRLFQKETGKQQQRVMFIDLLKSLMRTEMIRIPDGEIIRELFSYTENNGEIDTAPALFNQKILATAIAAQIVKTNPYFSEEEESEDDE